jgi:hypothetical protein
LGGWWHNSNSYALIIPIHPVSFDRSIARSLTHTLCRFLSPLSLTHSLQNPPCPQTNITLLYTLTLSFASRCLGGMNISGFCCRLSVAHFDAWCTHTRNSHSEQGEKEKVGKQLSKTEKLHSLLTPSNLDQCGELGGAFCFPPMVLLMPNESNFFFP